jgi:cytoskeleton protein RodZ
VSIGEALASARQERGLTVDDVSQSTRIRATLVRAIEHDDFSSCGGAVYARGHIRSIARALGIDPEPLVAEFDATSDTVPALVTDTIFEAETKSRPERSGPRWGFAMVAAVLVAICAVALNSILHSTPNGDRGRQTVGAAPTTSASPTQHATPRATPHAKPTQPNGPAVAAEPRGGVNLRIRVTGAASWLSVHNAAGTTLLQKTLSRGQVFDARDPRLLHLIVGDAGAVDLIVNGKELGPPGAKGAVMHLTFRPGDHTTSSQG